MVDYKQTITTLLFLAATSASAGTPINERKDADPRGEVEISNVAGEVTVEGWGRAEVEVTGELGDGVERLDFIRDGKVTIIKVVLPERGRSKGTQLNVKVPKDSTLSVSVVSADIEVRGVLASQSINAVSGDVDVELGRGDSQVSTVSGDVDVRGTRQPGALSITAVSGDIAVSNIVGELDASTVSGDIDVENGNLGRLRASTTNGDIDVRSDIGPKGRVDLETTNGDVELVINGKDDVNLVVDTLNGDIDNCFGIDGKRSNPAGPGSELRYRSGGNQRRLGVRTLNGDVEVCAY